MVNIDKAEVLRYLGYKNQVIDDRLNKNIDDIIAETKNTISAKYVYRLFDISHLENGIKIEETNMTIYSNDIIKHLENCTKCILMAVTIGTDIERKIMIKQVSSVNDALIMDACATTAVESVCDEVEMLIKSRTNLDDCRLTYRYSPGYGDFSIDYQSKLLDLLDANKKIGLFVSQSNILTPRKSVTAIIGLLDEHTNENVKLKNKCDLCMNREGCEFRKNDN